ncbi:HupE/UreJ family protein [Pseudocolwellia sp. HL-MZ7]|uniref:HupE/UreJ family protein n=1 Tax=Pseudocolwellia sp. HL-MZ7 TaxID=3400627 RepID=UPI003CF01F2C
MNFSSFNTRSLITTSLVMCLLFFFSVSSVQAHQLSTSYLNLEHNKDNDQYTGNWQIQISDLEQIVSFDLDEDKQVSWYEIKSKASTINELVGNSIQLEQGTTQCPLVNIGDYKVDNHYNEAYLVIPVTFTCTSDTEVRITYSALFDIDDNHKAIINLNNASRVLSKSNPSQILNLEKPDYLTTFTQYTYQGVLHIWMGIDHVLFLITLLLTSVLIRNKDSWQANPSKREIFKKTAWIITAFTLAHSITLTATALNLISFSSRWVELGIAFSVLLTAFNNVWPLILRLGWITFAFGLLHGMGFASVLSELGLSEDFQLLSILAFNLGVELGQLAILVVALPLLIWARNFNWYKKWVMPLGSLAIASVAVQWCIERF